MHARSKPGIYMKLYEGAEFATDYALELLLAAGIAALGLVLNSPAVVIGAMLVSPLMGPILATGLALAASDVYLGIKCLINIVVSIVLSVLFSAFLVWILPFHSPTAEVLARTRPNLLDLGVALFSGLAGALLVCRGGGRRRHNGAARSRHRGGLDASALHGRIRHRQRLGLGRSFPAPACCS